MTEPPSSQPTAYGQVSEPRLPPPSAVPAQQGWPTPPSVVLPGEACRHCDATPFLKAKVRGHRGYIVLMQFRSSDGPFCRDCGIATVRKMSADTMLLGWWSALSLLIAPIVLIINLVLRVRFNRLQSPVRTYGSRPPLDAGRPLYQRFAIVGLIVPLFVGSVFVVGLVRGLAEL